MNLPIKNAGIIWMGFIRAIPPAKNSGVVGSGGFGLCLVGLSQRLVEFELCFVGLCQRLVGFELCFVGLCQRLVEFGLCFVGLSNGYGLLANRQFLIILLIIELSSIFIFKK